MRFEEQIPFLQREERNAKPTHGLNSLRSAAVIWNFPVKKATWSTLLVLLPSFISSRLTAKPSKSKPLHSTAYLDGLRGVASLFVCWTHMSYVVFVLGHSYGYPGTQPGPKYSIMQLPFLRLIYGGASMVAIFFVISGYALSIKPLRQIHAGSCSDAANTISSSVFRRPLRLFLPPIASTFIVLVLVRLGCYEYTRPTVENKALLRNFDEYHQARLDTFGHQLFDWFHRMFEFMYAWGFENDFAGSTGYDLHLWTIPMEFRASMALFLTQFAVLRLRTPIRLAVVAGLIIFALAWARWEMMLFWTGMLIAESDVIEAEYFTTEKLTDVEPKTRQTLTSKIIGRLWSPFVVTNLICGMYLCSYPEDGAHVTPGFVALDRLIPKHWKTRYRFWHTVGAMQLVWAISSKSYLQWVFTTHIIQYLGNISFAIYLMHGPVLHTFGYIIEPFWWKITGTTPGYFELGFAIAGICNTIAIIWAGDLFWRLVDMPSVKFARWLEQKCCSS